VKKFPWSQLMRLGLGHLRLSLQEFWRSTLREISSATGVSSSPLLRQTLNELMEHYPDE
jgi:uncharacterized phage protein (TIGR02216 family)